MAVSAPQLWGLLALGGFSLMAQATDMNEASDATTLPEIIVTGEKSHRSMFRTATSADIVRTDDLTRNAHRSDCTR